MIKEESFHPEKEEIKGTNNFWTKLPNNNCPPINGEPKIRPGNFRNVINHQGEIDNLTADNVDEFWKLHHSGLFLRQTWREFFLTIDRIVEDLGLRELIQRAFNEMDDPKIIKEVKNSYSVMIGDDRVPLKVRLEALKNRHARDPFRDEVVRLSLPVFRRLLEVGYNQRDLTS